MTNHISRSRAARILILAGMTFLPTVSHAADITFAPSSASGAIGTSVSVSVNVSNNTDDINAVSGDISFPKDLLTLTGLSKNDSIISLWPTEPSYSNATGQVHFEGAILNPGFSGSQGKIITLVFKLKNTGKASILFTSGSVLANDGKGTNITGSLGTASILVSEAVPTPVPEKTVTPRKVSPTVERPKTPVPAIATTSTTSQEVPGTTTALVPAKASSVPEVRFVQRLKTMLAGVSLVTLYLLAIALLALLALYLWYKLASIHRRLQGLLHGTEREIHRSFTLLKEDTEDQLTALRRIRSRRELTQEEKDIMEVLADHLSAVEMKLTEKVDGIQKGL